MMKRCVCAFALGWVGVGFMATAQAGSIPDTFSLGRYVPGDVWMYIHGVHNPERAFIEKEWSEVHDAFMQSGILDDVKSLVLSNIPEQQDRDMAEQTLTTVLDLIKGVEWEKLVDKEFVFAERFLGPDATDPSPMPRFMPDYFLLCRGDEAAAGKNFEGLLAIVRKLTELVPALQLNKVEGDFDRYSMVIPVPMPYSLELFRKGEIIGIAIGGTAGQEVCDLLTGKAEGKSILDNSRFRQAMMQIPSPEDQLSYFDVKMFMGNMYGLFQGAMAKAQGEEVETARRIGKRVYGMVNFLDYVITTQETQGRRELVHAYVRVQSDQKDSPILKALTHRKQFAVFDKYIPADATGYNMTTGIDFGLLYHTAVDFVEKDIPDGAEMIAKMKQTFEGLNFDPDRDVFNWLSGELISITMPPRVVTPMGGADWVLMVRVKDAELASERINTALDKLVAFVEQTWNQKITLLPATNVNAEGFRSINNPMLAQFGVGAPVFGVTDDWFCLANSANTMNKCLATASGDAPSVRKNARFAEEGLVPTGPVVSASFADMSKLGQELGTAFGAMAMAGMFIPSDPETKPIRDVFAILSKLGPVLQKLDFFSSQSGMTTWDGSAWKSESVVTYKPPKQEEKVASAPEGSR